MCRGVQPQLALLHVALYCFDLLFRIHMHGMFSIPAFLHCTFLLLLCLLEQATDAHYNSVLQPSANTTRRMSALPSWVIP